MAEGIVLAIVAFLAIAIFLGNRAADRALRGPSAAPSHPWAKFADVHGFALDPRAPAMAGVWKGVPVVVRGTQMVLDRRVGAVAVTTATIEADVGRAAAFDPASEALAALGATGVGVVVRGDGTLQVGLGWPPTDAELRDLLDRVAEVVASEGRTA